jgi:hypothetical protein
MQATRISAVRGPTPGIVRSRTMRGSFLPIASSFLTTLWSCWLAHRAASVRCRASFPKFVGFALCQRLSERVDAFASGVPSFLASVDRDAMIDEPGADGAFHFVDTSVECLSVLDQRAELSVCFGGHVDGLEFIHRSHPSEFQGIVFVGLAFDVGPLPGVFVGGADEVSGPRPFARSLIQPDGPQASMTTRSILCFLKTVVR